MNIFGWLAALVLAALPAATTAVTQAEISALDDAIDRWHALGANDYSFDFQQQCNCTSESVACMRVDVVDGEIIAVVYAENIYRRVQDKQNGDLEFCIHRGNTIGRASLRGRGMHIRPLSIPSECGVNCRDQAHLITSNFQRSTPPCRFMRT